jgi:competence protein ComEC
MTVHFYDAGQALAALVTLPDGRHILVDTGESATRKSCGPSCSEWHERVMDGLTKDLGQAPIDLLWLTHQHSDHLGGAMDVLTKYKVSHLVDNGEARQETQVKEILELATRKGVPMQTVRPGQTGIPIANTSQVTLSAVVPPAWPRDCPKNPNDCSIGLRIDYCQSSVLFEGDAEKPEEAKLNPGTTITLLQVGHHGSNTSSTEDFIHHVQPQYAVFSSGKKGEGTNAGFCHPFQRPVRLLTAETGGPSSNNIWAFDAKIGCPHSNSSNWQNIPTSDHLWFTARDGDILLTTRGDGKFGRIRSSN